MGGHLASLRRNLGFVITLAFLAIALVSRLWTPFPPTHMRIMLRLKPPLAAGLLGTDSFGRDIASLLMAGAWNSLSTAFLSVLIGLLGGVALGTTAAAMRGATETLIMRLADLIFAFPAIISAIMLAAILGSGQGTAVLAIGFFAIPVFIRITQGAALGIWSRDYCLAARAAGKGKLRITLDHILPNISGVLAVQATIQLGLAILLEAGLSFLGLGLPPPAPSWGRMLNDAQTYLGQAPWMAIAPGMAIAVAVLGLNLSGDRLRDLLDPKASHR